MAARKSAVFERLSEQSGPLSIDKPHVVGDNPGAQARDLSIVTRGVAAWRPW